MLIPAFFPLKTTVSNRQKKIDVQKKTEKGMCGRMVLSIKLIQPNFMVGTVA